MDLSKKNKRNIRKIIRDSIHNFFEALLYSFFRPLICGHGDIEIPRAPGKKNNAPKLQAENSRLFLI